MQVLAQWLFLKNIQLSAVTAILMYIFTRGHTSGGREYVSNQLCAEISVRRHTISLDTVDNRDIVSRLFGMDSCTLDEEKETAR